MKPRPRDNKKYIKSRWPYLTEMQLRVVIRTAAARERNKPRRTRMRHRRTRLDAVAFYREKFGDSGFLKQYTNRKILELKSYWLPGGYAFFLARIHKNDTT